MLAQPLSGSPRRAAAADVAAWGDATRPRLRFNQSLPRRASTARWRRHPTSRRLTCNRHPNPRPAGKRCAPVLSCRLTCCAAGRKTTRWTRPPASACRTRWSRPNVCGACVRRTEWPRRWTPTACCLTFWRPRCRPSICSIARPANPCRAEQWSNPTPSSRRCSTPPPKWPSSTKPCWAATRSTTRVSTWSPACTTARTTTTPSGTASKWSMATATARCSRRCICRPT